jgi:hypothetical protein
MERIVIGGRHDQLAYCRRATHDQEQQDHLPPAPSHTANHIDPAYNAMTKIGLTTRAKTNSLECAVGISARKKLIHTMPLKADRPITRATVVGCAISATPQLFEITRAYKIKSPIQQQSCQNA